MIGRSRVGRGVGERLRAVGQDGILQAAPEVRLVLSGCLRPMSVPHYINGRLVVSAIEPIIERTGVA